MTHSGELGTMLKSI